MNKYIIVITALLFIASNTFSYFKGKDTGIEQQLEKDEILRQEQEEYHQNKIQKLNNSLKKVIYDKKKDYNFTGNLDDDQLLQALQ